MNAHFPAVPDSEKIRIADLDTASLAFPAREADKISSFFQVTPLDAEAARELYAFGYVLYQQARFSDAADAFLYLLLYFQVESKTLMALGACYQAQSQFGKAAELFKMSIDSGYQDPATGLHLGECLLQLNRKTEAVEQFKGVVDLVRNQEDHAELSIKAAAMLELLENSGSLT